jgi:hypothetical protein
MSRVPIDVPYGSWRAVSQQLEYLKKTGLLGTIDSSSFPRKTKQSTIDQVRQSLQQLGLIDDKWKPRQRFNELLRASSTAREQEIWQQILGEVYEDLDGIGWTKATAQQLYKFLETRGAKGETRKRASRFMRQALTFANIEYSDSLEQDWNPIQRKPATSESRNGNAAALNDRGLMIDLGESLVPISQPATDADLHRLLDHVKFEIARRRRAKRA